MAANPTINITVDTKQARELLAKMPAVFTQRLFAGLTKSSQHVEAKVVDDITKSGPWTIIPRKTSRGNIRGPTVIDSVDTGDFRASVHHKVQGLTGMVYSNKEYAPAIEFGSQGTRPRRHFKNTAAREKEAVVGIIAKSLKG